MQDIFYGLVLEGELKKLGIWVGNKKGGVVGVVVINLNILILIL